MSSIWESVFQRYSVLAKTVSFLGISGKLQVEDGVVHLVAERLVGTESRAEAGECTQPRFSLRKLAAKSVKGAEKKSKFVWAGSKLRASVAYVQIYATAFFSLFSIRAFSRG